MATARRSKKRSTRGNRDNRREIIQAAMRLFAENGYHGTSMREIAKEAGVALGLVTQFYGTKDALHAAVDDHVLTEINEYVEPMLATEQNFFEKGIEPAVEFMAQHQNQYRYLRRALVEDSPGSAEFFRRYHAVQTSIIRHAKRQGTAAADLDETWAALMLIFLVLGPYFCMSQVESITGIPVHDPKSIRKRNLLYSRVLQLGFAPTKTRSAATRASRTSNAGARR